MTKVKNLESKMYQTVINQENLNPNQMKEEGVHKSHRTTKRIEIGPETPSPHTHHL